MSGNRHTNPCQAAAVATANWYQQFNGKTKLVIQLVVAIVAIVSTTLAIEQRYAKASDVEQVAQATQTILDVMRIQTEGRKAILELKVANGTITPEQQVELANLRRAIAKMQ